MMLLVLVHSVAYIARYPTSFDPVYQFFLWGLGGLGAALFTTLVGTSFVLSMRSMENLPTRVILMGATARGVFLILVSWAINVLTKGPDYLFVSQILQLIGIASIVVALLRKVRSIWLIVIAAGIWLLAPLARSAIGFVQWWGGAMEPMADARPLGLIIQPVGTLAPGFDLQAAVAAALVAGVFPVIPWLIFPIIGMVIGRALIAEQPHLARNLGLGGVLLMALGVGWALLAVATGNLDSIAGYLAPISFNPLSTSLVLLQMGVVLVSIGIASAALDHKATHGRWLAVPSLFGRYALTVYTTSWLIIFIPVHIADWLDPGTRHMSALTGTYVALAFGIVLMIAYYPVLKVWDRHGGVGSLEWLMRRLLLKAGRPSTRDAGDSSGGAGSSTQDAGSSTPPAA